MTLQNANHDISRDFLAGLPIVKINYCHIIYIGKLKSPESKFVG